MSKTRGRRSHIRFGERRIIDQERAWYVAATWGIGTPFDESAADRQAEKALGELHLDVWMATYEETVVRRGRKVDSVLHFFPGYLFVGIRNGDGHDEDMHTLKRCRHVAGVMGVEKPLRVPAGVMQAIADAFSGNVKSERIQAAALYKIGEMMQVTDGPFASFYALVVKLLQTGHVLGEVSIFGRSTPVTFEPGQLARA